MLFHTITLDILRKENDVNKIKYMDDLGGKEAYIYMHVKTYVCFITHKNLGEKMEKKIIIKSRFPGI